MMYEGTVWYWTNNDIPVSLRNSYLWSVRIRNLPCLSWSGHQADVSDGHIITVAYKYGSSLCHILNTWSYLKGDYKVLKKKLIYTLFVLFLCC